MTKVSTGPKILNRILAGCTEKLRYRKIKLYFKLLWYYYTIINTPSTLQKNKIKSYLFSTRYIKTNINIRI